MTDSISALGMYSGLGSAGLYGSYDPAMMSMMGGYGSLGMMNPMMMMGGYNPMFMGAGTTKDANGNVTNPMLEYMKSMYSAQNEIQKLQLQNQVDMHTAKEQAQVYNHAVHNEAFFKTIMDDGYVKNAIREIYDAVHSSNMDAVATKYYELKQMILNKYSSHFANSIGGQNDKENLDDYISTMYSEIGKGLNPSGQKPDLRVDIKTFGENPFEHGLNSTFMGNSGHNKLTAEECLNQIYGTPINDKGSKAHAETIGRGAGRVKEFGLVTGVGAIAGATALGLGKTLPVIGKKFKGLGKWAWGGAALAAIGDILWQTGIIGNRA